MMASYYFKRISDGEKVVARTLADINAKAKREANKFGQAVQVFVDKAERGVGMKSHRQVSMARNPVKDYRYKVEWTPWKSKVPFIKTYKTKSHYMSDYKTYVTYNGYGHRLLEDPVSEAGARHLKKMGFRTNPEFPPDYWQAHATADARQRQRERETKPKRLAAHARRGWTSVAEKISSGAKPYHVKATKAGKSQSYKTMTLREAKDIAQALAENGWRAEVHHA